MEENKVGKTKEREVRENSGEVHQYRETKK